MSPTIGAYIIAKNNEELIEPLLQALSTTFDEITLVDTGSTDETVEIAEKYAQVARYYSNWAYNFLDDFAKARNMAMDMLNTDWVVWFDTDDIVNEVNLSMLKNAIKAEHDNEEIDAIACHYVMWHHQEGQGRTIRMAKNKAWRKWKGRWIGRIHELPQCDDWKTVLYQIDFPTFHKGESSSKRNLTIYNDMLDKGEEFTLEQYFDLAREYRQIDDYDKVFKYINKYIDGVNALPSLIMDETRSRQKFLALAYHYRSTYWFLKDELRKCREDAFLGIMVDDSVPHNFIQVGWVHARRGLHKRAIAWFMHAYNTPKLGTQYVDFHGVRTFGAVGALAMSWLKLGNEKKALKFFGMAMKNDPDEKWLEQHKELQELLEKKHKDCKEDECPICKAHGWDQIH